MYTMETLLYQTLSSDAYERKHATKILKQQEMENYSFYLKSICQVLANEDMKDNIRMSAGLLLKNSLTTEKSQKISFGWFFVDQQIKSETKAIILSLLATEKRNVANIISQVITSLASIDVPLGEWDDLINILTHVITDKRYTSNMKRTTLQTIGYICESLDPNVLTTQQKNDILTAIIHGARREEQDVNVKLAAVQALYNSLKFIKSNFENKAERDFIMKVLCEAATQNINSTNQLQVAAYECINYIIQLYYDKMDDYMSSSLFNLSLTGLNRVSDPSVMLQAIEFWSTVCTIELRQKKTPKQVLFNFAGQFVTYILPNLLNALIKTRDDISEDDDEWNVVDASAFCLTQFALICKEDVVPQTIQFIETRLLLPIELQPLVLWNETEAALTAFGCILKGPCKHRTKPLVEQMLPIVLLNAQHTTPSIRIAASWTLSRIIQESIQILEVDATLRDMVPVIHHCLFDENKKVIHNACLCVLYLAEGLKSNSTTSPHEILETGPLSIYTEMLLDSLLQVGQEAHYRQITTYGQTLYEAAASLITYSKKDCTHLIKSVTEYIISKFESLLSNYDQLSVEKKEEIDEFNTVQSNLMGVLLSCIYRLSNDISPYCDRIMTYIFKISYIYFNHTPLIASTVVEDAYLLISAMISSIGTQFTAYMDQLRPYLPLILRATSAQDRLCLVGIGIISDICSTLPVDSIHADECMAMLLDILQNRNLHGDVKPATISCIGDVAHAIGPSFMPYVETVMMVLQQVGNMQSDPNNEDASQYVDTLRLSSMDAFIGMLQGLSQDETTRNAFQIKVVDFLLFVNGVAKDEMRSDRLDGAIFGLIGDVTRIYGDKVPESMVDTLLNTLIIENLKGKRCFSKRTQELAAWAQQMKNNSKLS